MLFWLLPIIAIFILVFIKRALIVQKGRRGEKFVSRKLNSLDPARYKILNDVMLPSNGSSVTTQIDHIVVSNYGVFCIETKSYKGWIFGNAYQDRWTQVIYRYKKGFYNPLRQNFAHVKAIERLLGSRLKKPIVSLVAFPMADKLQISGTDSVGYAQDIMEKIMARTVEVFSSAERDEVYCLLATANVIDKEARKLHNYRVRGLKRY